MNDPNYHVEYDYSRKQWKRLRWNPYIQQWEFSDYYDGPPPVPKRDSHQYYQTSMPVAETTQPYTAYAGPSNPQYNQVQQPYTYPQSSTYQTTPHQPSYNEQSYPQPAHPQPVRPSVEGRTVQGSWDPYRPTETLSYEELDNSYCVRPKSFFKEGRLFAVLFTEGAGANSVKGNPVTDYNSALSRVMLGGWAYTQVRRFIVVRAKKAHCFAVPIFTYQGQGTKKSGVAPQEHAIAYSYGTTPELLDNEEQLAKAPVCIVMNDGEKPLAQASRIYFGIHHPIQYNVKVKDLGYVHPDQIATFLGYWRMENDTQQAPEVGTESEDGRASSYAGHYEDH